MSFVAGFLVGGGVVLYWAYQKGLLKDTIAKLEAEVKELEEAIDKQIDRIKEKIDD